MPNPYVVTIGASDKTLDVKARSLRFTESLQSRGALNFQVVSADGSYKPGKWQPVTIQRDGAIVAKGLITLPPYGGVSGKGTAAIETSVSCGDLKTHWEKRRVTVEISEGTMKAALQNAALAAIYTGQGFTLDQPDNGPTVGPFDFQNVTLHDAIRAICDACDPVRVIELDLDDLEFRLIEPGDTASPWDIDDSNQRQNVDGDLTVEPHGELEANNVIVEFGSDKVVSVRQDLVFDGVEDTFALPYLIHGPLPAGSNLVGNGVVRVGGRWEPVGDLGGGTLWEYDPTDPDNPVIVRSSPPPAGTGWIVYDVKYPKTVRAFDTPSIADIGQVDHVVKAPNLYSKAEAQRIADQTLAAMLGGPRIVRYQTTRPGLRVGMTQSIQSTIRDIDADWLITEITAEDHGGECLVYHVTAIEGGLPPKPWQDTVREASSGGGSGGSSTSPPAPGGSFGGSDLVPVPGGSAGSPPCDCCRSAFFTLTDSEFKALPSTYKELVPAPGPGKINVLLHAAMFFENGGGGYGNYDADQGLVIAYGEWLADASNYQSIERSFYGWKGPVAVQAADDGGEGWLTGVSGGLYSRALINQPLNLVGWNDAGDFNGGSPLNSGFGVVCYAVLDVPDQQFVPSSCTTEVFSDDFESGSALSTDYDGNLDVAKTASVGFGGSQGLKGTGSSAEQYYGYVSKVVTKDNRRGCVTAKFKPDTAIDQFGIQMIRISATTDTGFAPAAMLEVVAHSDGIAAGGKVQVNRQGALQLGADVSGVLADDTWVELRLEFEMSSVSGGAHQADGWAKLFVNGVLSLDVSGQVIRDPAPGWAASNPNNYWQLVQYCPLGLGDDLVIGKP
jgi:hypothetical protein